MSRQYEKMPDDDYTVTIDDMSRCKNMYDEVCCDGRSPWCGDYPDHEYNCKRCPWFEKEDGVAEIKDCPIEKGVIQSE